MASLPLEQAPGSLCLLRLSAIGDVTHMLPIVATLRQNWPDTKITWIIGKSEYQLVKSLLHVEFIVFDKSNGLAEYAALRRFVSGRRFDVLLMMQVALRASLISLLIKADIKIGYDKRRSRDFQQLFSNQQINGPDRVHVLDSFFQFLEKLGLVRRQMDWLLKAGPLEREFASKQIAQGQTVIINPCSSARANNWRNWSQASYARVIDNLMERGVKVILTGGPVDIEKLFAERVAELCKQKPLNLTGQTSLLQLLALLEQAVCLVAPDTGPAHMATIAGIPVIGLYASSNPFRTGPYNSQSMVVNAYPAALQKYKQKSVDQAAWGERVRNSQVMGMISVEEVMSKIDQYLG